MTKKIFWNLFLVLSLVLLAGCGKDKDSEVSGSTANEGTSELNLYKQGSLTFAMSGMYKPFNYVEAGELKGFDVEIGKALAKEMGLKANPVTNPWESIVSALKGKKFDVVIGSMAITEKNKKEVNFTEPYYYSGGAIFVAESNDEIKSTEDLTGKRIGVVAQSTYDVAAKEYTDDIKYYTSDVTALNDLTIKGRLDAVITAPVIGLEAKAAGLEIKQAGDALWIEHAGIAVRKEDEALLKALNEALQRIIENGEYERISKKMFGSNLLELKTEGIKVLE
ncbi:transporter substrate-binding domain-containing protein [Peribacillus butanolivorans]|uniref:transporter substrate-binding domain-containing protein n=1 Tax=Peribacillus butanolivorans TaxID=421767 RepID=UPI003652150C